MWSLVGLVFVLVVIYDYVASYLRLKKLPFRTFLGWPILHRLPVFVFHMDTRYDDMLKEFGDGTLFAVKRSFLSPITIISADPAVNQHILRNVDNYEKGGIITDTLRPLLGDGIFNVNGKLWLDQRKMASFMFAKKEVKHMVEVFRRHFKELEKRLEEGKAVEMQDVFSCYTLDSFCDLSFGVEVGSLAGKDASPFPNAFNVAQRTAVSGFVFYPFWKILPEWVFPFVKRQREAIAVLDNTLYSLILERRNDPELENRVDMLSRYLVLQKEQQKRGVGAEEVAITDKYIRDVCLNFILAGRDTTAQTLLWATYLLSLPENREVKEKVYDEVREVEGDVTYEKVENLPYTEHFIYEALRLYPPVPDDVKSVVHEDTLPGGIKVYPGENIIWSQNVMGRSCKFFDKPLEVRPERWLGAEHNGGIEPKVWSGGFIPFQNGGRRVCMGQEMALAEVKATLCMLAKAGIEFDIVPGQKIIRYPNVTISAKHGIWMTPKKTL